MTGSQLCAYARGWLEHEILSHLLPDPFTYEDVRNCIATYYPGGCQRFVADDGTKRAAPVRRPLATMSPTWFNPPDVPIEKVCVRDGCEQEFQTQAAHRRYCSPRCRKRAEHQRYRARTVARSEMVEVAA